MMYSKEEKQLLPLIAAAFLLGLFSLNPMARAEPETVEKVYKDALPKGDRLNVTVIEKTVQREPVAQPDRRPAAEPVEMDERNGLSLGELSRLTREPLIIQPNEKKTGVDFIGDVPARCVYDKNHEVTGSIDYDAAASKPGKDGKEGVHVFRINLPLCENTQDFKKVSGEKMFHLADLPGARSMNNIKGKVVLASGYKSDSKPKKEELRDENGDAVVLESEALQKAAERAADEARIQKEQEKTVAELKEQQKKADEEDQKQKKAEAERQAKLEKERIAKLVRDTADSCKEGDVAGIEKSIGNIPELRDDFSQIAFRKLKEKINEADSIEDAVAAWDELNEAADRLEWSEELVNKAKKAYIEKRFALIAGMMDDGTKLAALDKELTNWSEELRKLDSKEYKSQQNQDKFGKAYGFLGAKSANLEKKKGGEVAKAVRDAEKYYLKASKYAGTEDRDRLEAAIIKVNGEGYKACVRAHPFSSGECDTTYRESVKAHGEKYADSLNKRAENGDEDAKVELANFARDYLQAEGYGQSMTYGQFGTFHQMPGYFEQFKVQTAYQAQMNIFQQYQQQAMQQYYGQMFGGMNMGGGFGLNMGAGMGLGMQRASLFGF